MFYLVNNFQSKRKTPTSVTFYRGERMFGSDSTALMGRKPELTFSNIYRMMGRSPDHPVMQEFQKQYFPYQIYTNETTGATTFRMEDTHYTPEELMALILQHVKDMSEAFGGKAIKDCVITVPSSFTQHEREAVYTAADIADLKVNCIVVYLCVLYCVFGFNLQCCSIDWCENVFFFSRTRFLEALTPPMQRTDTLSHRSFPLSSHRC